MLRLKSIKPRITRKLLSTICYLLYAVGSV
jgi:hypothetical protein